MPDNNQTTVNITINAPRKSMAVAIILAFLFGPLGLLYASVTGGLVLLAADLVAIVLSFVTFGLGAFLFPLIWIASIIWAVLAVQGKEKSIIAQVKAGNLKDAANIAIDDKAQP